MPARSRAPALVLLAIASVQIGGALARTLFDRIGAEGAVALRTLFAAVLLLAVARPRLGGRSRRDAALVAAFGVSLAAMNGLFYEALARVPLGVAVSLEFVGPLAVALAGSRHRVDVVWALGAAGGVVLLAGPGGGSVSLAGAAFALAAGAFWAAYILLSARVGRAAPGSGGLALALGLAALLLTPLGVAHAGSALLDGGVLMLGAAVALLSSVLPYTLELEALRRLPPRVFGILLSLEPAVAALAGLLILGQGLAAHELAGIALVIASSAGVAFERAG